MSRVVLMFQVVMTRRRHETEDESTEWNQAKPTQMPNERKKVTYDKRKEIKLTGASKNGEIGKVSCMNKCDT